MRCAAVGTGDHTPQAQAAITGQFRKPADRCTAGPVECRQQGAFRINLIGGLPIVNARQQVPRLRIVFSSFHPGSVNFALGDGSVKGVSFSADPVMFRYWAGMADGETPDDIGN